MATFKRLQFDTSIIKASSNYRIWIPKKIREQMPSDIWIVESTIIRAGDFKQSLFNHPVSRTGQGYYIPIYAEDKEAEYSQFGRVSVEITFDTQ